LNSDAGAVGNDSLYGDAGNDALFGGDGNDKLYGCTGDDFVRGEDDNDVLYGDDGNDHLDGGNGNNVLFGGAGNDTLTSWTTVTFSASTDTFRGGLGNDLSKLQGTLSAVDANVPTIVENANEGTDTTDMSTEYFDDIYDYTMAGNVENLFLARSNVEIGYVNGDFFAFDDPNVAHVIGNALNNSLTGTNWADILEGGAGNDVIYGGGSVRAIDNQKMDELYDGTGDDTLYGSVNKDFLSGDDGDDVLVGGVGDSFYGGYGNDTYVILGGKP